MPAYTVDPGVNERRQPPAVEEDARDDTRQEGQGELDPAHRATAEVTAPTYPVGESGSRCGSDQRAVMPPSVGVYGPRHLFRPLGPYPRVAGGTLRRKVLVPARATQRDVMRVLNRR